MNDCTFCGAARPLDDGSCSNCGKGARPARDLSAPEPRPLLQEWTRARALADPDGFKAQQTRNKRIS